MKCYLIHISPLFLHSCLKAIIMHLFFRLLVRVLWKWDVTTSLAERGGERVVLRKQKSASQHLRIWNMRRVQWISLCICHEGHIRISDLGLAVRLSEGKLVGGRVGTLFYMGMYTSHIPGPGWDSWCCSSMDQLRIIWQSFILVSKTCPSVASVNCAVPARSILGSLVFMLYMLPFGGFSAQTIFHFIII